jgi:PKD repeat protein
MTVTTNTINMTVTTNTINITVSKPNFLSISHNNIHMSSFLAGLIAWQSLSSSLPAWYFLYRRLGGHQDLCGWARKICPPLGLEHRTVKPIVSSFSAEISWLHEESSAESSRMCRHVTYYVSIRQKCMSFRFSHTIFGFYCSFTLIKEVTICLDVFSQTAELFWVVQNFTLEDEGNYSCHASNVAGRSSTGTWLAITGDEVHVEEESSTNCSLLKFVLPVYGEVYHTCVW